MKVNRVDSGSRGKARPPGGNHFRRVSYFRSSSCQSGPAWRRRRWPRATAARPPLRPSARRASAPAGCTAGPAGTQSRRGQVCPGVRASGGAGLGPDVPTPHRSTRALPRPSSSRHGNIPRQSTAPTEHDLPESAPTSARCWQLPPLAPLTGGVAARLPHPPCASSVHTPGPSGRFHGTQSPPCPRSLTADPGPLRDHAVIEATGLAQSKRRRGTAWQQAWRCGGDPGCPDPSPKPVAEERSARPGPGYPRPRT